MFDIERKNNKGYSKMFPLIIIACNHFYEIMRLVASVFVYLSVPLSFVPHCQSNMFVFVSAISGCTQTIMQMWSIAFNYKM